jgi:hypothetical protein
MIISLHDGEYIERNVMYNTETKTHTRKRVREKKNL